MLWKGYVEAADTFCKESGTQPGVDLNAITDRMEIRKAVQSGNVDFAVERVNDLSPEVTCMHAVLQLWAIDWMHATWLTHHRRLLAMPRARMQILEEKQELYFHLQQQRLIELIRQGKTEEALEFAQDILAPQGEENPEFLEELGGLLITHSPSTPTVFGCKVFSVIDYMLTCKSFLWTSISRSNLWSVRHAAWLEFKFRLLCKSAALDSS